MAAETRGSFPRGEAQWVTEADARRLLVATEGDEALARAKLGNAVRWKCGTLDPWLATDGPREIRVVALGHQQRPMCYHCAAHQRQGDVLAAHWACCWHGAITQAHDPLAQVDTVLDCTGFQLGLNLSLAQYLKLASSVDSYFAERIHRLVIIDFPRIAEFLWRGIQPFLPPKTREKVMFVSRNRPESMARLYELCVDEAMRQMLAKLLRMNGAATPSTGRELSHAFTDDFLRWQRSQLAASAETGQSS